MKNSLTFCLLISMLISVNIYSQSENYAKFYNKGNNLFDSNFEEAEKNYRIAIDDSSNDLRAAYNLSNKYYNEGLYDEAISRQIQATILASNKSEKHSAFHNLGNSFMKKEMCSDAILAYKNALRNNPDDDETRYNLALAKKCEEDQDNENNNDQDNENNDQDNENNDQDNENNDQDNDNNDQDNENNDQDNENNDQENKSNDKNNKENQNNNQEGNDEKNNPKKQSPKLSSQQIKNLLKATENAEKKVQAKVNENKKEGKIVISEKDW